MAVVTVRRRSLALCWAAWELSDSPICSPATPERDPGAKQSRLIVSSGNTGAKSRRGRFPPPPTFAFLDQFRYHKSRENCLTETPTILLHLSDIHFRHRWSGTIHDLDSDLRSQLEIDAGQLHDRLGVIHGIIVSGDIAFSGCKEEYRIATDWLYRLCDRLRCDSENVWTVPGNHDVDREAIKRSIQLQLLHKELRNGPVNSLDERLRKYLSDDEEAGSMLFRPLQNYNAFALQFNCNVSEKRLFWEHNLVLNDGSTLRIRGATSAIVSDEIDHKHDACLVVGSAQSLVGQQDGVEYLFVCHHPPDWLVDEDNINDHLRLRTRIQLFGHKHAGRMYDVGESLRIYAGATHPDRDETEWEPSFNLVSIWVRTKDGKRTMELDVYPRVYRKADLCFKADPSTERTENHHRSFLLPPWNPPISPFNAQTVIRSADTIEQAAETSILESEQGSTGGRLVNPARRLTYRFMSLPYQVRIEVAQKLQLIENEDSDVKDAQRYEAYFRRAKQRELVARLWEAVERAHGAEPTGNPFSGQ